MLKTDTTCLFSPRRNFFSFSTDNCCNILVKEFVDSENLCEYVVSLIIDKSPTLDECTTTNIKLNKVGEIIEKEELHWPKYKNSDSKREYHSMVRGLILNEVIRRIDPQVGLLHKVDKTEGSPFHRPISEIDF